MNVNCTCVPTCVPCMAIARVAICVFHAWHTINYTRHIRMLTMFHATRKCGPPKHIMGLFKGVAKRVQACRVYHTCVNTERFLLVVCLTMPYHVEMA